MFVKYLQNLSAISMGSVNVLPSDLNDGGRDDDRFGVIVYSFGNANEMNKLVFEGFILRLRRC